MNEINYNTTQCLLRIAGVLEQSLLHSQSVSFIASNL